MLDAILTAMLMVWPFLAAALISGAAVKGHEYFSNKGSQGVKVSRIVHYTYTKETN